METLTEKHRRLAVQYSIIARHIQYPDGWDTMAYPTLADAVIKITKGEQEQCTHKEGE